MKKTILSIMLTSVFIVEVGCGNTEESSLSSQLPIQVSTTVSEQIIETESSDMEPSLTVTLATKLPFEIENKRFSAQITQADFEIDSWVNSDGTYTVKCFWGGEMTAKTELWHFDSFSMGIRVYDEEDCLVKETTCYSPKVDINEKFKNKVGLITGLEGEHNYTLVLVDVEK